MTQRNPFETIRDAIETKAGKAGASTLIVLGALGLAGCAPNVSAEPEPTQTSVETVEPTPEVTPTQEQLLTVEKLLVPVGLDAETLGRTIIADRFNAWVNAGADDSLLQEVIDSNLGWNDFLPKVADKYEAIFAKALYIDGWEQNPNLVQYVNGTRNSNLGTLDAYTATAWNSDEHPENLEAFKQWVTIDSVKELSASGDERTIEVNYTNHDNSDKNMIDVKGREGGTYTVTFRAVDGFEKITAINVR